MVTTQNIMAMPRSCTTNTLRVSSGVDPNSGSISASARGDSQSTRDTASDDAVALIGGAAFSKRARVIAITTVAANVGVQQATRNALYTAELCGAATPVYQGAEVPLTRSLITADWFHAAGDGLGDHGDPSPSWPREAARRGSHRLLDPAESRAYASDCCGPLTNIALALESAPDLDSRRGALRRHGRSAVLRGERHAGRRIQYVGRSRSRAHRVPEWFADRIGGVATLPRDGGSRAGGHRVHSEDRHRPRELRGGVQQHRAKALILRRPGRTAFRFPIQWRCRSRWTPASVANPAGTM